MVQGQNTFVQKKKKSSFSAFLNGDAGQSMIAKSFANKTQQAQFTASLLSAVGQSEALKQCEAGSIISAGLHGVSMGLSLPLGQYSIIPYGTTAKYQISYKGLAQLAIRSGEYADINVFDVRAGEYLGRDKLTRRPSFEWIEDDDEREQRQIIGYYAYFVLNNGFTQSVYWSHDKILHHADRYAKAFKLDKYEALLAGQLDAKEAEKLRSGSPWYDLPDSEAHMKMCRKTVLMQLLNSGFAPLSTDMQTAIAQDEADDTLITAEDVALGAQPTVAADFTEAEDAPAEAAEIAQEAQKPAEGETIPPAPAKRGRPKKQAAQEDDFEASFFGDGDLG